MRDAFARPVRGKMANLVGGGFISWGEPPESASSSSQAAARAQIFEP